MRWSGARALLALAGVALGPSPASANWPANAKALPDWLSIESKRPGADVSTLYRSYLLEWMGRNYSSTQMLDSAVSNPSVFRYSASWPRDRPEGENRQIVWKFYGSESEQWPHAAYRLTLPVSPPYKVRAEVYCGPSATECEETLRDLASLPAPEIEAEGPLRDEWIQIVREETCDASKASRTGVPIYPPEAMRRLIRGTVELKGIANRCGDVRAVQVSLSSGDRSLDKAAQRAAKRWRLPTAILSGKAGVFGATIVFEPGPDAEAWRDSKARIDSIWKSRRP